MKRGWVNEKCRIDRSNYQSHSWYRGVKFIVLSAWKSEILGVDRVNPSHYRSDWLLTYVFIAKNQHE